MNNFIIKSSFSILLVHSLALSAVDAVGGESMENNSDDPIGPVVNSSIPSFKPYQFAPIDTEDLYAVNAFYHTVFKHSDTVPFEWDGNVSQGDAGDTSLEFKKAVIRRVNYFRAMAGVPARADLDLSLSAKAQEAALIMGANDKISHFPDRTWLYYSSAGAEAASSSNLAIGSIGANAVSALVDELGDDNYSVGHRRAILDPGAKWVGTGDVGSHHSGRSASALTVRVGAESAWPQTRNTFVAWPSDGYMPYQLIPRSNRWSFSLPIALNVFSQAKISMKRNGRVVSTTKERLGEGSATLVWQTSISREGYRPRRGVDIYDIEISNVLLDGQLLSYAYQVRVFDPESPNIAALMDVPAIRNHTSLYGRVVVDPMPNLLTDSFLWKTSTYGETSFYRSMESNDFTKYAVTPGYNTTKTINGLRTLHLAHLNTAAQTVELKGPYLLDRNAKLDFSYFIGLASKSQVLRVYLQKDSSQILLWQDAGEFGRLLNPSDAPTFHLRNVNLPLDTHVGEFVSFKIAWEFTGVNPDGGGAFYWDGATLSPWYKGCFLRAIDLYNVKPLQSVKHHVTQGNFLDLTDGTSKVYVSAAPVIFGGFSAPYMTAFSPADAMNLDAGTLNLTLVGEGGNQTIMLQWNPSLIGGGTLQMSTELGNRANWKVASDYPIVTDLSGSKHQFRPGNGKYKFFRIK